jgi:hypothetical protein
VSVYAISVSLVVKIIVESDTLYEGQIVDTIRSNSRINIWTDISGTALEGVDFYTRRVNYQLPVIRVFVRADDVWEGYEDFQVFVEAGGLNFVLTFFIRDLNGKCNFVLVKFVSRS